MTKRKGLQTVQLCIYYTHLRRLELCTGQCSQHSQIQNKKQDLTTFQKPQSMECWHQKGHLQLFAFQFLVQFQQNILLTSFSCSNTQLVKRLSQNPRVSHCQAVTFFPLLVLYNLLLKSCSLHYSTVSGGEKTFVLLHQVIKVLRLLHAGVATLYDMKVSSCVWGTSGAGYSCEFLRWQVILRPKRKYSSCSWGQTTKSSYLWH